MVEEEEKNKKWELEFVVLGFFGPENGYCNMYFYNVFWRRFLGQVVKK